MDDRGCKNLGKPPTHVLFFCALTLDLGRGPRKEATFASRLLVGIHSCHLECVRPSTFFQETYVTYLDHSEITRFLVQKNKVSVGRASLRAPINSDPAAKKKREVNRKSCRVEPIPKGVYSVNFEVVSRRVEFISREKD